MRSVKPAPASHTQAPRYLYRWLPFAFEPKKTIAGLVSSSVLAASAAQIPDTVQGPSRCYSFEDLSFSESVKVNRLLTEIDKMTGTAEMIRSHIDLMVAARGALNYCEIELRLRQIKAKTFLLALPYDMVAPDPALYTLFYPQPTFPTWSKIPKFTVWYERRGEEAALQRLMDAGIEATTNLDNLNKAGSIMPASNIHKNYVASLPHEKKPRAVSYPQLSKILDKYREKGNLTNKYNSALMYAIDSFIEEVKYSINAKRNVSGLQFYVIDTDPDRILRNFPCNCAYIPKSNLIICDALLLKALSNWAVYDAGGAQARYAITLANDGIADTLLYWLVGHEIGHYMLKHDYAGYFNDHAPGQTATSAIGLTKSFEEAADAYAMARMPDVGKGWVHMTVNYTIQQLVARAAPNRNLNEKNEAIFIHESEHSHPNLLRRMYLLKKAAGAVDFLLEELESKTIVNSEKGARFPGVCVLANGK